MSATAIATGLATFGPQIIRAAGSMFGGDTKKVADQAADVVETATGSDDPESEIERGLSDLSPEQITALQSVKTRAEEIRADERKAARQARADEQAQVNETMRAEYKADSGFRAGWRPAIGYVAALSFGGLVAALVYAIVMEPSTAPDVIDSATIVLSLMLGVLGVNVKKRSEDKAVAAGQAPAKGAIASLVERLGK